MQALWGLTKTSIKYTKKKGTCQPVTLKQHKLLSKGAGCEACWDVSVHSLRIPHNPPSFCSSIYMSLRRVGNFKNGIRHCSVLLLDARGSFTGPNKNFLKATHVL
jgi:hypothetical protein